jgi:8-oxo-dGTP pyrophosphatase MutT (NUDIX family)
MQIMLPDAVFVDHVKSRLAGKLPGRDAQYRMASLRRLSDDEHFYTQPAADARVASVLNLLHWHYDAWHTVLIQRSTNPRDRHSGQVSFPGGRLEENDGSLENVALREVWEEVGVEPSKIEVLGRLTELYIPVSNYVVHPFVGILHGEARFTPQPGEVENIFTPNIDIFRAAKNRKVTDISFAEGMTLRGVPYFDVNGLVVWGATAMIMNEFLEAVYGQEA